MRYNEPINRVSYLPINAHNILPIVNYFGGIRMFCRHEMAPGYMNHQDKHRM